MKEDKKVLATKSFTAWRCPACGAIIDIEKRKGGPTRTQCYCGAKFKKTKFGHWKFIREKKGA